MSGQQVIVSVLSDIKDYTKGMNNVAQKADSLFSKIPALIAGAFAVDKVVDWGKQVVDEFTKNEDDIGNIALQMGDKAAAGFDKWAQSLATSVGVSKVAAESMGTAMAASFAKAGLGTKDLEKSILGIIDITAATGKSQEEVTKAWDNSIRGKTAGFAKLMGLSKDSYDAMIKQTMAQQHLSKAEATEVVNLKLSSKYKGQAKDDANSLGGQMDKLSAIWSNFGQAIAVKVMPYVIEFGKFVTEKVVPAAQDLAEKIQNGVVKAFNDLSNWYNANKDWFNAVAVGVAVAASAFALWTAAINTWQAVTKIATAVQAAFNAVMDANPIGIIILAVAALVAGLVYFFTQTETGKALWQSFVTTLTDLWNGFSDFIGKVWDTIVKFFEDAGKNVTNAWNAVSKWFSELPGKIKDFFTKAINFVLSIFLNYTPLGLIIKNWQPMMNWFGKVPGWIKDFFSGAVKWLVDAGENVLSGLWSGIKSVWNTVDGWFGGMPGRVLGFYAGAIKWLLDAGRDIITGNWSGLKDKWSDVANWFSGLPRKIKDFFGSAGSWLKSAGHNVVEGLWNGISSGYTWIRDKIRGWVGDVLAFIKRLFGISSPSTVMEGYGDYLVQGLAKGVVTNLDDAQRAMGKLSDAVQGGFNPDLALATVRAGGTVNQYFIDGVELNLTPAEEQEFLKWADTIKRKAKAGV